MPIVTTADADAVTRARALLGLSRSELGLVIGFGKAAAGSEVWKAETGKRKLHASHWRLINAYLAGYRPDDWPVPGEAGTFAAIAWDRLAPSHGQVTQIAVRDA